MGHLFKVTGGQIAQPIQANLAQFLHIPEAKNVTGSLKLDQLSDNYCRQD